MAERLKRNIRRAEAVGILTVSGLGLGGAGTAIASQLPESSAHVQIVTDTSKGMDLTGNGVVRLGKTDTGLRGSDNKKAFVVKTAQPGDSLRSIVTDNLQENRGQKVTRAHIDREVAITAVASGITNVNADLRQGQQVAVPDKEYTSTLIHAGNNRGDAELKKDVLAMNAEIRKEGIGPALDEAQKVVDKMGVKPQELKSGEAGTSTRANETNRRLGITDQDAKTDISRAEMQRRIDNAKKNGWIETSALHDDHIWDQQKYENRTVQSNAETNMTSRMAVQLTKFDSKLNPNGNFDEYRMREGDKFNEFNEQMDTLMGVVGSMNTKELISIKQDLPHDVWVKLIQIWAVNQGTAVNDDIRNRDVAAASVYLEIAERIDLKNAPKEVKDLFAKWNNAKTMDEKKVMLLSSPESVKQLFDASNKPENPKPGQNPGKPGGQGEIPSAKDKKIADLQAEIDKKNDENRELRNQMNNLQIQITDLQNNSGTNGWLLLGAGTLGAALGSVAGVGYARNRERRKNNKTIVALTTEPQRSAQPVIPNHNVLHLPKEAYLGIPSFPPKPSKPEPQGEGNPPAQPDQTKTTPSVDTKDSTHISTSAVNLGKPANSAIIPESHGRGVASETPEQVQQDNFESNTNNEPKSTEEKPEEKPAEDPAGEKGKQATEESANKSMSGTPDEGKNNPPQTSEAQNSGGTDSMEQGTGSDEQPAGEKSKEEAGNDTGTDNKKGTDAEKPSSKMLERLKSFGRNLANGTPAGKIGDESGKEVFRVGDSSVVVPGKPTEEPQTTPEKANQEGEVQSEPKEETKRGKKLTQLASSLKNSFRRSAESKPGDGGKGDNDQESSSQGENSEKKPKDK